MCHYILRNIKQKMNKLKKIGYILYELNPPSSNGHNIKDRPYRQMRKSFAVQLISQKKLSDRNFCIIFFVSLIFIL